MNAFLFSDLHGSLTMLKKIELFLLERQDIGLLVFVGDFLNSGRPVSFVLELIKFLKKVDKDFVWVSGNNDFGDGFDILNEIYPCLDGRERKVAKHRFVGIGGSPIRWEGESDPLGEIQPDSIGGSILLWHYPPPGRLKYFSADSLSPAPLSAEKPKTQIPKPKDPEKQSSALGFGAFGFSGTSRLAHSPLAHICGHLHSRAGIAYVGGTKIVKLGGAVLDHYAIMNVENLKIEFGRLK
ncbi:MAG: metallophosphoesterase [Patescibacteria group bacterium]